MRKPLVVELEFRALVRRWRNETGHLSSITKKIEHPAYRNIIELGEDVVPLVLRELEARPAYWFHALEEITKHHPDLGSAVPNFANTMAAWLAWGKGERPAAV